MNASMDLVAATSQNPCRLPLLPMSVGPGTLEGFEATSFCLPPCCVPCPPQDTFFPQYVRFFKALEYVNLLSLTLVLVYCLLWISVLYRCPKTRMRSRYVVGTAVALVFWHIPEFITLVAKPNKVLCENEITRATTSNHLCAAQGFIFLFSTHAVVLWGGLRIAYVHLQMRKSSKFYLHHDVVINNSIAWGIPALFATVALSLDELGYVTSHYCGPTLSKGEALLWVPLLVYISMASVLQTWTLYEIARAVQKAHNRNNGHECDESEDTPISGTFDNFTSTSIHLGTRSEITDWSMDGMTATQSEVTDASATTYNSRTPLRPSSRFSRLDYLRAGSRRGTLLSNTSFTKPRGEFSQTVKDRVKFVWELLKLNSRMLISLSLTSFVAIFISVNSLLFQKSIYNLPNSSQAFVEWMQCMQTPGNTAEICSVMADQLLPLSFWRNVTADTARASFGIIFFIVELTKGDFWRALKERHPFALPLARGPRKPLAQFEPKKTKRRFLSPRLPPILPTRIRFSFIWKQSTRSQEAIRPMSATPEPTIQFPPLAHQWNIGPSYYNTFPRSHSPDRPRVYLHTPQCEIDRDENIIREYRQRMSLPPVAPSRYYLPPRNARAPSTTGSLTPPSTSASLRNIATDTLDLESRLEHAAMER